MFSIISEVKYIIEKDRDFPPMSKERPKLVRKSRLSQDYFQDHVRAATLESEDGHMPVDQHRKSKKPLKFKDALGRKFAFPFHLVATWTVRNASFTMSWNCRSRLTICREWKN